MILIPSVATERASAKFVFTHFNTDNGEGINSKVYIFVLGLLMSQYTLTGYDASAHMVSLCLSLISFSVKPTFKVVENQGNKGYQAFLFIFFIKINIIKLNILRYHLIIPQMFIET